MRNGNVSRAMPPRHYWDKKFGVHIFDDFATHHQGNWYPTASGTGAAITFWSQATALPNGWIGATRLQTGTTTTGVAALGIIEPVPLGQGQTYLETLIRIPVLSDGTETYYARFGFLDIFNGESTDAIGIRYTHSVNGGKFEAYTRSNSTETAVDTGVTVAANTDYKIRIEVNADASSAKFYINGTLVATITTNIPSGNTRLTGVGANIVKSAGTTMREFYADYLEFDYVFTTPRT